MSENEVVTIPRTRNVSYAAYASLPTTGLKAGDLGFATDRLVFYRWSGAAWQAITFHSSSGLAAAIPTAADLPNGSIYFETDTTLLKQVQAGAWVTLADIGGDIATHAAIATAHQDAPGLIATHAAIATAHQDAPTLIATHAAIATAHQDAPGLIATHAAISDAHHAQAAPTKEEYFVPTDGTTRTPKGNHPGFFINATDDKAYIEFYIPADFSTLTALVLEVICDNTNAGATNYIDIYSDYHAPGEAYTIHSETDETLQHSNIVANQAEAWDVSSVFSNLAAGDICGLQIDGKTGGVRTFTITGLRLKYS